MKKTGILIGSIIIVISISATYLLFNTKNETALNHSKPVNEITDKRETKDPLEKTISTPAKKEKLSLNPET